MRAIRANAIAVVLAASMILPLASAARAWTGDPNAPAPAPTTAPSTTIDQSKIDAAIAKMQKHASDQPATPATQPATPLALATEPADYRRDVVTSRKLELLHDYDLDIAQARQALRHHDLAVADVRELVDEQSLLQQMPLDKFRDLLMECDVRNARRAARYREAFGDLEHAAATVVTILMKAGMIDSAQALPDDPLSQEIEESHGVRRVYFRFILPAADSTGAMRRHNGFVEFQLAQKQGPTEGLWLPTWADLVGDPIPLFDLEAFAPLRPYRIVFDGINFIVAQESPAGVALPQIFSLMSVRAGESNRRARASSDR